MPSGIVGPNGGGTRRDFGLPGKDRDIPESVEERIFREARMRAYCRYCEEYFIRAKENQRFHTARCGTLFNGGNIHEATFARWAIGLAELFVWWEGQEDTRKDGDLYDLRVYKREHDIAAFDFVRRRLYYTIVEMQARAKIACAKDSARTWKQLAEGLMKLWELPHLDLFSWYNADIIEGQIVPDFQDNQTDLPCRGLKALQLISETWDKRWMSGGAKILPDHRWLEL